MIKVTIEMLPGGMELGKYHLGTVFISNDLSASTKGAESPLGNYKVRLTKKDKPTQAWKEGYVKGFRRLERGAFDLLYLALKNTIGGRNGG